jgi:hypothetical protein
VRVWADAPDGGRIANRASIVFDTNEAIETNEVWNTVGTTSSPTISGFTPASGLAGTVVTINGANLTGTHRRHRARRGYQRQDRRHHARWDGHERSRLHRYPGTDSRLFGQPYVRLRATDDDLHRHVYRPAHHLDVGLWRHPDQHDPPPTQPMPMPTPAPTPSA